jgi:imidazolonepropionase-like amidohydrolase
MSTHAARALTRAAFSALAITCTAAAAAPGAVLLRPAQLWTAGEPVHRGWVVLTDGAHIAAVGPEAAVQRPAGAQVIDLPGATLLPGLMDIHSHLFLHP